MLQSSAIDVLVQRSAMAFLNRYNGQTLIQNINGRTFEHDDMVAHCSWDAFLFMFCIVLILICIFGSCKGKAHFQLYPLNAQNPAKWYHSDAKKRKEKKSVPTSMSDSAKTDQNASYACSASF